MAVVELLETPLSKGPEYAYLRERILEGGCCGALAPVPNTRSPVEFGAWRVDVPIACKDDTTKDGTTTVATDNAMPRPESPGSWRGRSKAAGLPPFEAGHLGCDRGRSPHPAGRLIRPDAVSPSAR